MPVATQWQVSHRFDPKAVAIADRHYNRQKPGTPQFVPPGRCIVLLRPGALWVTSWPYFAQHAWGGAWVNSLFRRESGPLASEMIREAVAVTRWFWPRVPDKGMVTFIDPRKIKHKRDPGRCYRKAGFHRVGQTAKGLLVFQLLPLEMPEPLAPCGYLALEVS